METQPSFSGAGTLEARLARIRGQLAGASEGRYPVPRLIAVTKNHPASEILPLTALGVTDIGENRVQETMGKLPLLGENFRLHLIGRLQSNKVKYIIKDVALIQSVDRLSLAREIDRQGCRVQRQVPVLVQVSPAGEPQKGGLPPEEVPAFLREIAGMDGLRVKGLMAVMPNTADEAYLDGLFAGMRSLYEHLREEAIEGIDMEELSMGMSHDYLIAARRGATMVRIGTALMGPRTPLNATTGQEDAEHGVEV